MSASSTVIYTLTDEAPALATCSLLPCENEDVIAEFLIGHPGFRRLPVQDVWRDMGLAPVPGMAEDFHASPLTTGTDGFFAAILVLT